MATMLLLLQHQRLTAVASGTAAAPFLGHVSAKKTNMPYPLDCATDHAYLETTVLQSLQLQLSLVDT
jgi:hypothetical protein